MEAVAQKTIQDDHMFFSVFPTLELDEKLTMLLEEVRVDKIVSNKMRDCIKVYVNSGHMISGHEISRLENRIKEQLFSASGIHVEVVPFFQLSETYSPETIYEEYKETILSMLQEHSAMLASALRRARLSFSGAEIFMELGKTLITEAKKEELVRFLEHIFEKRFRRSVTVVCSYCEETKTVDLYAEDRAKIERQIRGIFSRSKYGDGRRRDADADIDTADTALEENYTQNKDDKKDRSSETIKNSREKKREAERKKERKKDSGSVGQPRKSSDSSLGSGTVRKRPLKTGSHPDLIYGRDFDDPSTPIEDVISEMNEVVIRGKIIDEDKREIRNEKTLLIFAVTDFTDTITVKMFIDNEHLPVLSDEIKKGKFISVKGAVAQDKFDHEYGITSVKGIRRAASFGSVRMDTSARKRVELHCHTKMSDMDAVSDVKDIVKRAHDWGHPAIAITDHGVVQSFPTAHHYVETLPKDDPFKVIYGVEGYVVDDLVDIAVRPKQYTLDDSYVVFDIETTGFSSIKDKIIEIGAVKIVGGHITDTYSTFVNPERPIPYEITRLTNIDDGMVSDAPSIEDVLPEFLAFCDGCALVAHNAGFDVGFIEQNCRYQEIGCEFTYLDTVAIARILLPALSKYKLNIVAKALGVSLENHHRAVDDAMATADIFIHFIRMLKEQNVETLEELNQIGSSNANAIRKMPMHHIIILAKNNIGRLNLYKLVSESHMTYYARRPRIPKSLLNRHREGLIIGSACEAGELFSAVLEQKPQEHIAQLASYYDYFEIQPLGNNHFLIESSRYEDIRTEEDLENLNRTIVALGEQFQKPVVATCDAHFLDADEELYRRIIMAGKGYSDSDSQPPLYFRTTEEMLDEFAYLGSEKAREIVIDNPCKIASMVERISPVNPNKCPPVIPDSDRKLRTICQTKAREIYGEELPAQVSERLERELNSIISNGYAVMYIIAQELVWKSNEDGYLVGSRGSVGSSFVATMAGITEVNPLSPHYICPHCHYSDFDSEQVRAYAGGCGYDMPDRDCPQCGHPLKKDGFDIPFETFLGFKGDKEPDIDLNFSGDYQAKAHKYTEVLFGEGYTFKAGTIGTLADKTAFGYVKKYFEEKGIVKRNCEVARIASSCTGIRRSTGQHPGGIVVLPHGHDINEFTPVQHPANDMKSDIVTTHFDYHSIDHNLLKLDILGHDDPTMIRTLEDFITSDAMPNEYNEKNPFLATTIPLDDPQVIELFHGTDVLGIAPKDISGYKLGCLGIPEFGTDFVIQMVQDAKPKTLSDLIRISGLSHGTNVWVGNAQDLVKNQIATISTVICTRDDIMLYLIQQGVESALAFTIMESVRKGKGLKPEWEDAMRAQNVPEWYIDSCKKISYMFPKAHAAAYVMMAYRIAYCKINYPLAYYAAYFSIRADAFSYELMCHGKEKLNYYMAEYRKRADSLSKKEQDTLKDMCIVQEMYARGFTFLPIDLYEARAAMFRIIDGKLMPSFSTIEGLGEKAAEAVEEESKKGRYLSVDDFRTRTKVSKTVTDVMSSLGLFGDLPQSNQLSLFD